MGNPLFTDDLPVDDAPLVVKFDEAVQARSGKGINFYGAVIYVKETKQEIKRGDPFFLMGMAIGKGAITNPFELTPRYSEKHGRYFWNLQGMQGKPEVVAKDAPAETSYGGGNGARPSGKGWTFDQLKECHRQCIQYASEVEAGDARIVDWQVLASVAATLFIAARETCEPEVFGGKGAPEQGVSADEVPWEDEAAPAIDDKDIPFAWLLPLVGLLWMA